METSSYPRYSSATLKDVHTQVHIGDPMGLSRPFSGIRRVPHRSTGEEFLTDARVKGSSQERGWKVPHRNMGEGFLTEPQEEGSSQKHRRRFPHRSTGGGFLIGTWEKVSSQEHGRRVPHRSTGGGYLTGAEHGWRINYRNKRIKGIGFIKRPIPVWVIISWQLHCRLIPFSTLYHLCM